MMIQQMKKELESVNIAIINLSKVLEKQSKFAHMEWARDQLRVITMDLQGLINTRNSLLKEIKQCDTK